MSFWVRCRRGQKSSPKGPDLRPKRTRRAQGIGTTEVPNAPEPLHVSGQPLGLASQRDHYYGLLRIPVRVIYLALLIHFMFSLLPYLNHLLYSSRQAVQLVHQLLIRMLDARESVRPSPFCAYLPFFKFCSSINLTALRIDPASISVGLRPPNAANRGPIQDVIELLDSDTANSDHDHLRAAGPGPASGNGATNATGARAYISISSGSESSSPSRPKSFKKSPRKPMPRLKQGSRAHESSHTQAPHEVITVPDSDSDSLMLATTTFPARKVPSITSDSRAQINLVGDNDVAFTPALDNPLFACSPRYVTSTKENSPSHAEIAECDRALGAVDLNSENADEREHNVVDMDSTMHVDMADDSEPIVGEAHLQEQREAGDGEIQREPSAVGSVRLCMTQKGSTTTQSNDNALAGMKDQPSNSGRPRSPLLAPGNTETCRMSSKACQGISDTHRISVPSREGRSYSASPTSLSFPQAPVPSSSFEKFFSSGIGPHSSLGATSSSGPQRPSSSDIPPSAEVESSTDVRESNEKPINLLVSQSTPRSTTRNSTPSSSKLRPAIGSARRSSASLSTASASQSLPAERRSSHMPLLTLGTSLADIINRHRQQRLQSVLLASRTKDKVPVVRVEPNAGSDCLPRSSSSLGLASTSLHSSVAEGPSQPPASATSGVSETMSSSSALPADRIAPGSAKRSPRRVPFEDFISPTPPRSTAGQLPEQRRRSCHSSNTFESFIVRESPGTSGRNATSASVSSSPLQQKRPTARKRTSQRLREPWSSNVSDCTSDEAMVVDADSCATPRDSMVGKVSTAEPADTAQNGTRDCVQGRARVNQVEGYRPHGSPLVASSRFPENRPSSDLSSSRIQCKDNETVHTQIRPDEQVRLFVASLFSRAHLRWTAVYYRCRNGRSATIPTVW